MYKRQVFLHAAAALVLVSLIRAATTVTCARQRGVPVPGLLAAALGAMIAAWAGASGAAMPVGLGLVAGVPSLDALAWDVLDRMPQAAAAGAWMDASRGEVFAAAFTRPTATTPPDWPLTPKSAHCSGSPPRWGWRCCSGRSPTGGRWCGRHVGSSP